MTAPASTTRLCHGCRHLSPRDAYCSLWGRTRHAHDEGCREHSDGKVRVTDAGATGSIDRNTARILASGGFDAT
jgi:hypothetical protein